MHNHGLSEACCLVHLIHINYYKLTQPLWLPSQLSSLLVTLVFMNKSKFSHLKINTCYRLVSRVSYINTYIYMLRNVLCMRNIYTHTYSNWSSRAWQYWSHCESVTVQQPTLTSKQDQGFLIARLFSKKNYKYTARAIRKEKQHQNLTSNHKLFKQFVLLNHFFKLFSLGT